MTLHCTSQFFPLLLLKLMHKPVRPLRDPIFLINKVKFYKACASRSEQNRHRVIRIPSLPTFQLTLQSLTTEDASTVCKYLVAGFCDEFCCPGLDPVSPPLACSLMLHNTASITNLKHICFDSLYRKDSTDQVDPSRPY
jgi:hypothetical protein